MLFDYILTLKCWGKISKLKLDLTFDWVSCWGGGAGYIHTISICGNNSNSNKIAHCVELKSVFMLRTQALLTNSCKA